MKTAEQAEVSVGHLVLIDPFLCKLVYFFICTNANNDNQH